MFTKIVWATDGSEHGDRSLTFAESMASGEEAALTVLHVVQRFAGGKSAGLPGTSTRTRSRRRWLTRRPELAASASRPVPARCAFGLEIGRGSLGFAGGDDYP